MEWGVFFWCDIDGELGQKGLQGVAVGEEVFVGVEGEKTPAAVQGER